MKVRCLALGIKCDSLNRYDDSFLVKLTPEFNQY